MKLETVSRLVGSMWAVLVSLASVPFGVCTRTTVHATAGNDVLLPCSCLQRAVPYVAEPYVAWQIDHTVVDQYTPGHNKSNIALQFLNRTRLFLHEDKGNCSLLLRRVMKEDEKTYTCHYYTSYHITADVYLIVNSHSDVRSDPVTENEVSIAISAVLLALALLFAVFLGVRYRERCLRSQMEVPGPLEAERKSLNPGTV